MISGANEEELDLAKARMDIMLATNYTPDNPGPLAIIDKYYDKEIERLDKQVQIMEKYFELIIDLGYDYDGFNSVESLKTLIDELCKYASLGRACNTTESIYANSGKHFNIIGEEIKGGDDNE